jgi:RES domain
MPPAMPKLFQEDAGLLMDHPTREVVTETDTVLAEPEPVVLFAVRARLNRVLDLADEGMRGRLGVSEAALLGPWRWEDAHGDLPLTQRLGQAAYASGRFEAIRYPSHKNYDPRRSSAAACWAVFVERLSTGSYLEVADISGQLKGRLPPA